MHIAPARNALAFAPLVSLMTELHFQLYKTTSSQKRLLSVTGSVILASPRNRVGPVATAGTHVACAFNMHGAPASGCTGGNNLNADTVEKIRIQAPVSSTQQVRRWFNQRTALAGIPQFLYNLSRRLSLQHLWYVDGSSNDMHLRELHSFLCLEIAAPVVASRQVRPTHDQRTEPVALHCLLYRSEGASTDVKGSPGRKSSSCRTTQVLSCCVPNWQTNNTLTS